MLEKQIIKKKDFVEDVQTQTQIIKNISQSNKIKEKQKLENKLNM